MIRAIIFDLDGTLVDAYPGIHESLNETLRSLNLPEVEMEVVKRRVGRGVVNLLQQSVPAELVERGVQLFRSSYNRTHLTGTFVLPDVLETLKQLYQRNISLAVASNKPTEFTRNILRHQKLDPYIRHTAGPDGDIQPKPHPSMLTHLMQSLQVEPQETLYIGDMTLDAETARNAKVRFALIATGGHSREELARSDADFLLDRFKELIGIVDAKIRSGGSD